jgi:hypothetical protein
MSDFDPCSKPMNGHCPKCGPSRLSDVVGHHDTHEYSDDGGVWGKTDYRILQCRGCKSVYFQTSWVCSEGYDHEIDPETGEFEMVLNDHITYWPAPAKRTKPEWIDHLSVDPNLYCLFNEIYVALNNNLHVLAAIGIRTAFDRASQLLGVDANEKFAEKLAELVQLGKIGSHEQDALDSITHAGNAAAHRGWSPKPEELATMMNIIEAFLHRVFILDAAAKKLKGDIPKRQINQKCSFTNDDPLRRPPQHTDFT